MPSADVHEWRARRIVEAISGMRCTCPEGSQEPACKRCISEVVRDRELLLARQKREIDSTDGMEWVDGIDGGVLAEMAKCETTHLPTALGFLKESVAASCHSLDSSPDNRKVIDDLAEAVEAFAVIGKRFLGKDDLEGYA